MIKNKNVSNKALVISGIIVLLLILISGYLVYRGHRSSLPKPTTPQIKQETINNGPTTQQEKDETDAHKQSLAGQNNNSSDSGSSKAVSPVITYAGQSGFEVEIDSYVGGIVESGGTCTLKLTSGQSVVSRQVSANADATTTVCPAFILKSTDLSKGGWKAVVDYSSSNASGISEPKSFVVQ